MYKYSGDGIRLLQAVDSLLGMRGKISRERIIPERISKAIPFFAGSAAGPLLVSLDFVRSAWGSSGTSLIAAAVSTLGVFSGIAYVTRRAFWLRLAHGVSGTLVAAAGSLLIVHASERSIPWVIFTGLVFLFVGLLSLRVAYQAVFRFPGLPPVDFRKEVSEAEKSRKPE